MGKKKWLVITLWVFCFPFTMVDATETQQVETDGSIGFTGTYEPIGTPKPTPPESIVKPPVSEVTKPGGRLPQTNDSGNSWFTLIGISVITFVFLLLKRMKKQNIKLNR